MTLALFDLDNTLLSGDSDYAWGEFLVEKGIVDAQYYAHKNAQHFEDYKAGKLDMDKFIEFQLEPLKSNPRDLLEDIRVLFLREVIQPMISYRARSLVHDHRQQGHTLIIITATNRFITQPIAQEFGIEQLIATEVEEINGAFTGKTFDIPSFSEGKVTRLKAWLENNEENLEGSWFYSDSHNDLPLLNLVDNPVALNPDTVLRKEAERRQWRIVEWL
ncbi:MAG: HAD family hydrolase [Desulfobulbia bacterium]